jgi:PHD/YefM family antitoxin component YafN of YafNO toxin-antitoxin module
MISPIPVHQAREHLGELIEEAYYLGKPFVIKRGKKLMAALIGTKEFGQILRLIEKYDRGLADTLAIMSNPEILAILEEGDKDVKRGNLLPFDKNILDK